MAVYGYARVSTSRQAEEGESLDVQERTVAGYALMLGLAVDRMFVERGVSGSVPLAERTEGIALLAALKPGDVLITAKLDRMFRSALDALDVLAKLKVRQVSLHMIDLGGDVTGNGISKLVFTILSAVAEAERDRIRERVTQVKRDQRQRNRYLGGIVPFGFRVGEDGALVPDAAEQVLIAHARALRADGATLRAIQAVLETQHGRKLSLDALHRVLADTARPPEGTPNHDVAGDGPASEMPHVG
jgi:DNA invertase Pin-like site-specific DNA recombinase